MELPKGTRQVLSGNWLKWLSVALIDVALLYIITLMYAQGETLFAMVILILASIGTWVFTSQKAYNFRYVYPSLLGVVLFVVFPLLYTVTIAFTNYSSTNLLSFERVKQIHLEKNYRVDGSGYRFNVYSQDAQSTQEAQLQLVLESKVNQGDVFVTQPFVLGVVPGDQETQVAAIRGDEAAGEKLAMREVIKLRKRLKNLTIVLPDNQLLRMSGLREFSALFPLYSEQENSSLVNNQTGEVIRPDYDIGYYVSDSGEKVSPGFTVFVGWDNFKKVVTDPSIQGPFLKIFVWTVLFALLTVVFTLMIGLLLACLVQWEPLKESGIYRVFLILPYAVPAFISILVFKGLFNQNFGEINMVLEALFGIKPEWMTNEYLAKAMILIVNSWLGYPYMMILGMGLLKAIPEDLYEASAIDGASPWQNLRFITLPMIIKPLTPLLIASFAFNFNNFVLINLLTGGGPNMIGSGSNAGATDILVSYTFRIAFGSYGQDFGLASAIAGLIFIAVGFIAWANLKATRNLQEQ